MMQLHLVFVGKTAFADVDAGIERYVNRLNHYLPTRIHTVKAEKISPGGMEETVLEKERERISRLIGKKEDYLIVWDRCGKHLDSVGFARALEKLSDRSVGTLWMVIGGPLGISRELVSKANLVLALSQMTFPHDLARLIVAEQLYRAFTIIRGEPYHK
jgi:23S rRNA (pseudouridine1915-N3)-methyltransferase